VIDQASTESYENELRRALDCTDVFRENTESGRKRWSDFKLRIVEHNIRIMAKYYKRIRLDR
jgi:26S proteasome regulatory subunit N5